MGFRISAATILGILLACAAPSRAQEAQPAPQPGAAGRPKVGLALGGGSARGLAHIGVLKWFEQHRIPIDVISGTSMGGLIAGAYASGMSPDEIAALMRATDWDMMFVADSPFRYKTFRRKQDKRAFPSQLEFGLRGGFRLPSGINPGQQVALLLDQIALPYWDLGSFDDLPTPFRCVATDLTKGRAVVLDRGPLSRAMRATMAIPGVFTPVNYENWLLVDGGAMNNVPADVARQMGASVVVAVNVAADEPTSGPDSMFSLLGRTIDAMMASGTRKALESADLVVDPDLTGLDSMAWRRSDELAQRGFAAAEAMREKLLPFAMSEADYAAFQAARQVRRRTERPTIAFVEVAGLTEPAPSADVKKQITRAFQGRIGKPLDPVAIRQDILRVSGTDRYEYLTYRAIERDGKIGLLIGVREKTYGPPFLALGLELSNIDSSSFSVNVRGRVTAYDVVGSGSELRTDLGLGTQQVAAAELYRPIGRRGLGFFVAPRGYFQRDGLNLFSGEDFVAEYRVKQAGGGIDFGYTTNERLEIRAGYDVADVRARRYIGDPLLPEATGTQSAARLQVTFDGQTSPIVPSHGLFTRGTLRHFDRTPDITTPALETAPSNPDHFTQGEITGSWFTPGKGQDRIFVAYGAGTSFGATPLFNTFRLGGPLRLGALSNDQITGGNYAILDGGYLKRVTRLPDIIGGNVYIGSWVETGSAWDEWSSKDWHTNISGGVIIESLIGPIFAGGSVGKGEGRFFISIGPLFK
jgi:NTE family protein